MDGGRQGVIELTAEEYRRLWDLDDALAREWCPKKAAEALSFLERQVEGLRISLGMLENQIPHLSDAKFGHNPERRALALDLDHTRYEAGLAELRRKKYEASLAHGPNHKTVSAIREGIRGHINDWLSRRH